MCIKILKSISHLQINADNWCICIYIFRACFMRKLVHSNRMFAACRVRRTRLDCVRAICFRQTMPLTITIDNRLLLSFAFSSRLPEWLRATSQAHLHSCAQLCSLLWLLGSSVGINREWHYLPLHLTRNTHLWRKRIMQNTPHTNIGLVSARFVPLMKEL